MTLWQDVRFATRLLRKDRWFALAAVVTLALGIAANNTVFSMVNGVLLRTMPFDQPERIVEFGGISYLDLQDMRAAARSFEDLGATDERTMNVTDRELAAERFRGSYVSANAFRLIGQRPFLGRDFQEADERPGAPAVVIVGYEMWQRRYQADPAIVGRTIRVNGVPSTVIGVMPQGFAFPQNSSLWQPLSLERPDVLTNRSIIVLDGFGRLREGVSLDQARIELEAIRTRLARDFPVENRDTRRALGYFRSGIGLDTPVTTVFLFMLGAVGFVLLIACANVANLLLARSAARSRELSIRMSIGATRWQIVRQLLIESGLLAVLAGGVGLLLSVVGLRTLWRTIQATGDTPPYWLTFEMDWRVLAFFACVCLGTAMLCGLAPAWLTSQAGLAATLSEMGRGQSLGRRSRRFTGAFVVAQLTLTLILLSGAGLAVRSLLAQVRVDPGVDTSALIGVRLELPAATYDTPERRLALFRQIEERFANATAVRVSYAGTLPLGQATERRLLTNRTETLAPNTRPLVGQITIGGRYFETLGTRAVRGRAFQIGDTQSADVAIVNERFAELYFPGVDAIGQQVRLLPVRGAANPTNSTGWVTIVGVAPNVRQDSLEGGAFDPIVYVPVGVNPLSNFNLVARSDLDITAVTQFVRREMAAMDPDLPLFDIRTAEEQIAFTRWPQRVFGSLFMIFAAIALVLGVVGLYAVTAYAASQRTRELGVRMALGAQGRQIGWLVTRTAALQLSIGVILGGAGGFAISRVLPSQLIGAAGADPLTLALVALLLVAAGLAACLIPALRTLRLNPVDALRVE